MKVVQEGEVVSEIIHRHWFYMLKEIITFVIVALAPVALVVVVYATRLDQLYLIPGNMELLLLGFTFLWLMFVVPMATIVWTDYHLDTLIITNNRLISIEQRGLFSREVSSFRLDRVQDVTVEIAGIIPTLLNFGEVHVQTAGEAREFRATYVPQPERVREAISDAHNKAVERRT